MLDQGAPPSLEEETHSRKKAPSLSFQVSKTSSSRQVAPTRCRGLRYPTLVESWAEFNVAKTLRYMLQLMSSASRHFPGSLFSMLWSRSSLYFSRLSHNLSTRSTVSVVRATRSVSPDLRVLFYSGCVRFFSELFRPRAAWMGRNGPGVVRTRVRPARRDAMRKSAMNCPRAHTTGRDSCVDTKLRFVVRDLCRQTPTACYG